MSNRKKELNTAQCAAIYSLYPMGTPMLLPPSVSRKMAWRTPCDGMYGGVVQRKVGGVPYVRAFFEGQQFEFPVDSKEIYLQLKELQWLTVDEGRAIAAICGEPFLSVNEPSTVLINISTASTIYGSPTDRSIWMQRNGIIEIYSNDGNYGGSKSIPVNSLEVYKFLAGQGYAFPVVGTQNPVELGLATYISIIEQLKM